MWDMRDMNDDIGEGLVTIAAFFFFALTSPVWIPARGFEPC